MASLTKFLLVSIVFLSSVVCTAAASVTAKQRFVVTNDDVIGVANTVTVYLAGGSELNPTLTKLATIPTGGLGTYNGWFSQSLVSQTNVGGELCAFASDAGSNDIAGLDLSTFAITGNFRGSSIDVANTGIGLLAHNGYLYAAFTGSRDIATFSINQGCTLSFLGDVASVGLGLSFMDQMAANGNVLIVVYTNTSIASFNVSEGLPVPNNDLQYTTGVAELGGEVGAVDITKDGHYAVFGGLAANLMIEVSDISSGRLTPTVVYGGTNQSLGPGNESANIWIGPEEEYLYVSDLSTYQVRALRFDASQGQVLPFASGGCISPPLKQLNQHSLSPGGIATAGPRESAGVTLYVAEDGAVIFHAAIAILHRATATAHGECTLSEAAESPVWDGVTTLLPSVAAYPPRPF